MTRSSPLFDYNTQAPFDDLGFRPSMLLAGNNFVEVKALIDRGIRADNTHPHGTAYYVLTADKDRNSRVPAFLKALRVRAPGLANALVKSESLAPHKDVMFYFIGAAQVAGLQAHTFIPGAVADHLTSFGGQLTDSSQMSALAWLSAGATASYGTVQEPCNFPQKFPNPAVLVRRYTRGESLIEAYWKSVSAPGEGVFVGEPLATPWK